MPGSRLAEEAGMQLADFYFNRRNMSLAADAYHRPFAGQRRAGGHS